MAGRATDPDDPSGAGGAALVLDRSRGGGSAALADLTGSFTVVEADPAARRVRIARDHLGARKVYYHLDRRWLIAASEASAILCHEAVPADPDEASAARFLGFRFGWTARSFFRTIRELAPAHQLEVTAERESIRRYWRFAPPPGTEPPPGRVDEEFRRRLRGALAADLADLPAERAALSLSGGLDSAALAALAPPGVGAFTWTLDDAAGAAEAANVEALAAHLDLPVHRVSGEGLHPLCDGFAERFVHTSSPYLNPFSALKCRLYEVAKEHGRQRIVVGDAGDAFYAAREYWLRDVLAARAPTVGAAGASFVSTLGRAARGDRFARLALARTLPVRGLRGGAAWPAWLTVVGRAALPETGPSPVVPESRRWPRHELIAGARHTELESEELRLFAACGVERANPFWSWPLLEWAAGLPADWFHRDDRSKVLTRRAFRDLLPQRVLESPRVGLLGGFFLRGIELRRDPLRDLLFRRPLSDWRRYVRSEWLEPYLETTRTVAFGHTILWRVVSYELWHRRLAGRSAGLP